MMLSGGTSEPPELAGMADYYRQQWAEWIVHIITGRNSYSTGRISSRAKVTKASRKAKTTIADGDDDDDDDDDVTASMHSSSRQLFKRCHELTILCTRAGGWVASPRLRTRPSIFPRYGRL